MCSLCGKQCTALAPLYRGRVCHNCRRRFLLDRSAAYVVDFLVFYGGLRLLLWSCGLRGFANQIGLGPYWLSVGLLVFACRVIFICKDLFVGRSPGKWIMGLLIVDEATGAPARWKQSIVRNLILLIPVIGESIVGLSLRSGWRLGDRIARTRVVPDSSRFKEPFAVQSGICSACGYKLKGNLSGICPECGSSRVGSVVHAERDHV